MLKRGDVVRIKPTAEFHANEVGEVIDADGVLVLVTFERKSDLSVSDTRTAYPMFAYELEPVLAPFTYFRKPVGDGHIIWNYKDK